MRYALPLVLSLGMFAGCVPPDGGLPLGSAQFTISGRGSPRVLSENVVDDYTIHIDRFIIAFRTMTIVNLLDSEQCAYRGRGAVSNVVFDGTQGSVVQAFNGIKPGACPDVGMRLNPPDDRTVLGEGATVEDIISLASGVPAIAILEATATRKATENLPEDVRYVSLRFDAIRTSTAFGGCRDAIKGAKIRPEARYALFVSFAAEALFRSAIAPTATLLFSPFAFADRVGNNDRTVTMEELDALPLGSVAGAFGSSAFYQMPSGSTTGCNGVACTFGDYVRAQFQFSVKFGEGGVCNGIDPGTPVDE